MRVKRFIAAVAATSVMVVASAASATVFDVFKTSGLGADFSTPVARIEAIRTAQTASEHYDFYSWSGHPTDVDLGPRAANLWLHEDTRNGQLGFGMIFGQDAPARTPSNRVSLNFRIVDSATLTEVVVSDDPREAMETPPNSNAFVGNYAYRNNSDGIMVDNLSGPFTIIVASEDFGNITRWTAAGGDMVDVALELGAEYRITPSSQQPSGATVTVVSEPGTLMILSTGLLIVGIAKSRSRRLTRD